MTLPELIDWVDAAMRRLPRTRRMRDRVKHVRLQHEVLSDMGSDPDFLADWHALGVKVAKLLKEPAPEKPAHADGKRKRKKKSSEAPAAPPRERRLARRPSRQPIEVNARLQAAFDAVAAGRQILFVTGGAGTGKSTFIRELRERMPERPSVVLAPTGVAALNAGGQTIHSFCRLPLRLVLPEDVKKDEERAELLAALEMVIIDEISMVRADILDGVEAFLRLNRNSDRPFGGVQMVLVGDLFQLPPVVTARDAGEIARRYPTPQFFSAHCLRGLKFFPVELEIVYRQRDASFAEMLAKIRDGVGAGEAVRQINEQCVGRALGGQHLILVPTRAAAAAENEARLAALPGNPRAYEAACEGSFEAAGDDRLPAPRRLVLKRGAQVMFVRNDGVERRWVNGTLGTVTQLLDHGIEVKLESSDRHRVERIEWQDVRYAFDETKKAIVEELAGTFLQFPLMPAWAVTIHKAQGLTLAHVLVDLDRGAFAEGQVYVALSRCQRIEGLSLRRPVSPHEVRCSQAARLFYRKIRARRSPR